jgi:hypothetical protein
MAAVVDHPPLLSASAGWLDYFQRNCHELLDVPWERGAEVTAAEVSAIRSSIQGFQLGESSEGRHLMKCARSYAVQNNDPDYGLAVELFIKEEQRHARDLGRFMDLAGIPRITKTWPDTVFRRLRHTADLEISISVLLTAEIIAKVYYPALRAATQSAVLRMICDQIIHDEAPHVEFQCQRLAILRRNCGRLSLAVRHALQRFLFFGTCFVVWHKHGRAMRAGQLTFGAFWQRAWHEFEAARRLMHPPTQSHERDAPAQPRSVH